MTRARDRHSFGTLPGPAFLHREQRARDASVPRNQTPCSSGGERRIERMREDWLTSARPWMGPLVPWGLAVVQDRTLAARRGPNGKDLEGFTGWGIELHGRPRVSIGDLQMAVPQVTCDRAVQQSTVDNRIRDSEESINPKRVAWKWSMIIQAPPQSLFALYTVKPDGRLWSEA